MLIGGSILNQVQSVVERGLRALGACPGAVAHPALITVGDGVAHGPAPFLRSIDGQGAPPREIQGGVTEERRMTQGARTGEIACENGSCAER